MAVRRPYCETGDGIGEWYFFKTSVLEKLKPYQGNSEVLDRKLSRENNLPLMKWFRNCSLKFHCLNLKIYQAIFFLNFD